MAQRSQLAPKCTPGRETTLTSLCCPWQCWLGAKVRGYGQMISAVECREHAIECRQMSERAPNLRVRNILIDMARGWEGVVLETEHSAAPSPKIVLRHQFLKPLGQIFVLFKTGQNAAFPAPFKDMGSPDGKRR